jgi:small-conductance mechanosensitive channel
MTWSEFFGLFTKPLFQLGQTWVSLATMVQFVIIVLLVVLISRVVRRLLRQRVLARTKLDLGIQYAIARIVSYIVLVLGLLIGLETLGLNLSSLAVIAGALGVGIGFGLQNIVSNFVCGLILLTERPIQIGDRVDVGGTMGGVIRIGARSTTIVTNDNFRARDQLEHWRSESTVSHPCRRQLWQRSASDRETSARSCRRQSARAQEPSADRAVRRIRR